MTPEQAADKAVEVLIAARQYELDPERVAAMAVIADGWTRLHTALKMGQTELVTVNMSDTVIREPVDPASLPDDLRSLIDAVNQMREEWTGSDRERRRELWREMRRYADATWRLANNLPVI